MKDLSYLDNIAKDALHKVEIDTNVSWNNIANKINKGKTNPKKSKDFNQFGAFLKSKVVWVATIVITVSSVIFITISGKTNNTSTISSAKKVATKKLKKINGRKAHVVEINKVEINNVEENVNENVDVNIYAVNNIVPENETKKDSVKETPVVHVVETVIHVDTIYNIEKNKKIK